LRPAGVERRERCHHPIAIRRDIELFYLKDHPELDRGGNIAALLRFRADQNRTGQIAAVSQEGQALSNN